jgi:hypothetical protein
VERRGAPPTSIATARQFLDLIDLYAAGREFFDDEMSNRALIELRRFVIDYIERFEPEAPQICQWEHNRREESEAP